MEASSPVFFLFIPSQYQDQYFNHQTSISCRSLTFICKDLYFHHQNFVPCVLSFKPRNPQIHSFFVGLVSKSRFEKSTRLGPRSHNFGSVYYIGSGTNVVGPTRYVKSHSTMKNIDGSAAGRSTSTSKKHKGYSSDDAGNESKNVGFAADFQRTRRSEYVENDEGYVSDDAGREGGKAVVAADVKMTTRSDYSKNKEQDCVSDAALKRKNVCSSSDWKKTGSKNKKLKEDEQSKYSCRSVVCAAYVKKRDIHLDELFVISKTPKVVHDVRVAVNGPNVTQVEFPIVVVRDVKLLKDKVLELGSDALYRHFVISPHVPVETQEAALKFLEEWKVGGSSVGRIKK